MIERVNNKLVGFRELLAFDNAVSLVVDRLLFRSEVLVYRYRGMSIIVDHVGGDVHSIRECLARSTYRDLLCGATLPNAPTVVDIGANCGGFPILLRSCSMEPGLLACAEMNPNVFRRLRFNIEGNILGRKYLANVAIGGVRGKTRQKFSRGDAGERLIEDSSREGSGDEIEIVTFDDFLRDAEIHGDIDLCKIDIEGAEHSMLQGRGCESLARCRYVIIEIHSTTQGDTGTALKRLSDFGLKVISSRDAVYLLESTNLIA